MLPGTIYRGGAVTLCYDAQAPVKHKYRLSAKKSNSPHTVAFKELFLLGALLKYRRQSSCGGIMFVHLTAGCCIDMIVIFNTVRLLSLFQRFTKIK